MINKIQKKKDRIFKDCKIENILNNHNYINAAKKAKKWINYYTIKENGIVITSRQREIYQEVTGYYIPTLLQWGMRDKAINYAKWLCENQQPSGAWMSFDLKHESVFNTGQVLRGLAAICGILPETKDHLEKGCEWLLSNMASDGRLLSAEGTVWPDSGINSELIHIYCLPPLIEAGQKLGKPYYRECAGKILDYYKKNYREDILNFNYLSHFYAYVLEALADLGETELVSAAMKKIERLQRMDGMVPAYRQCHWVCSTGLFQLAIIWFKLGKWEQGNKAFDYAVRLQNKSGGWYGGYPADYYIGKNKIKSIYFKEKADYFPDEEISWAVKYFFDALYHREILEFERKAHLFLDQIDSKDGKYQTVFNLIQSLSDKERRLQILDVGCGKSRYLKKLCLQMPQNRYYGVDLSKRVLSYCKNKNIILKESSILKIDYKDNEFDIVYAVESLEHAVLIEEAVKELARVLKPGGRLLIIDKDKESFDRMKYASWIIPEESSTKQWLDKGETIRFMERGGLANIESFYIPTAEGNMFRAFIGSKEN